MISIFAGSSCEYGSRTDEDESHERECAVIVEGHENINKRLDALSAKGISELRSLNLQKAGSVWGVWGVEVFVTEKHSKVKQKLECTIHFHRKKANKK